MITVTQDDIGRSVIYRDSGGKSEVGVIIGFNTCYVHVRYGVVGSTAAATSRKDLEWLQPARAEP